MIARLAIDVQYAAFAGLLVQFAFGRRGPDGLAVRCRLCRAGTIGLGRRLALARLGVRLHLAGLLGSVLLVSCLGGAILVSGRGRAALGALACLGRIVFRLGVLHLDVFGGSRFLGLVGRSGLYGKGYQCQSGRDVGDAEGPTGTCSIAPASEEEDTEGRARACSAAEV